MWVEVVAEVEEGVGGNGSARMVLDMLCEAPIWLFLVLTKAER